MTEIKEEEKQFKLKLLPKIGIFLGILICLLISYMFYVEPKLLTTKEYPIINEKIPDSFNGFKIVQFSDIHFGRTINEKELLHVVEKINENKPDILVFTGDLFDTYINITNEHVDFLKESLGKTEAKIGKYAIRGDSDYLNIKLYDEIMTAAGFTLLDSQNIPIFYEGTTPIYLGGISSISQNKPNYENVFKKESEGNFYQILLSHEPIIWQSVQSNTDLLLTGHSLGGLITVPFVGGIVKKENTNNYLKGFYQNNDSTLYVSNGIGTEDISFRFANIPSITLFRLYNYK